MTRQYKCVECRHCEPRLDPRKGARYYCARKKRVISGNIFSRPACEKFELPKIVWHCGP